jgi:hypothetical protein
MKIVFVLSALTLHVFAWAADPVKVVSPSKTLSGEGGRFVFGQISEYRRDQYMLDTRTGRLWQTVEATSPKSAEGTGGQTYIVLQEIRYVDRNGRESSEPLPSKEQYQK